MKLKNLYSLLFLLFGFQVSAQTNLTAKDAVFIALENNYSVQIAERQEDIARTNNTWGEAGLYPTVTLNVAVNNTVQDNTNNPFTFTPGVILMQSVSPNLNASWNIFSGFAVRISKERLEQLELQSNGNAIAVIEVTIQDVLKAYYTVQLQKERLELFKVLKEFSKKRMTYYELKEKYASSSSLELMQFKNQFLTDSTNYLIQEISYNNAMRNLLLLMNQSEEPSVESFPNLTDKLEMSLPLINLSEAISEMKANNQNLKNQYIALELQKIATDYQKSFMYPTLSFQAGITPSYTWLRDLNNADQKFNTQVLSYYGNFNLRYTIFNNYKTKRAVDVSRIQEEIVGMNVQSMEKTLSTTLTNLLELYEARTRLLVISDENLIYASKAFDLAQKRFDMGTLSSVELSVFQNNYQNTLIQHYENQFNKIDTYLEIYKLMGKLGLEYSK